MNLLERVVLEHHSHLWVVREESAERVMQVPANRALEVRELHQSDGSIGRAERGAVLGLKLGASLRDGVFCEVRQLSPEHVFPVPSDINLAGLLILTNFYFDINFLEPFHADVLRCRHFDSGIGPERIKVSQVSLDRPLDRQLLCRSRSCDGGRRLLSAGNRSGETDTKDRCDGQLFLHARPHSLRDKPLGNRKWPAKSKSPRGDFKPWSGLLALVLGPVDKQGDLSYELQVEPVLVRNLLRAAQVLNISLKDTVQDIIRRQTVLVLLIGAQFRGRDLLDARSRDEFPIAIDPLRELVNHQFWYVGNHREPPGHVAVKRTVTPSQLGFVARAENHGPKFVGNGHQKVAADTRLDVFFRHVDGP